jgi:hypothetical protein
MRSPIGGFLLARLERFHFRTKRRYERELIEHSLRVSMAAAVSAVSIKFGRLTVETQRMLTGAEYSRTIKPPFHDIMRAV